MPIDVTLEDDGGLIITATGNFTGEEMIAAAESLRQQGVTPSDVAYELVDMRDSTPIDHSEIVAQQLTAYVYNLSRSTTNSSSPSSPMTIYPMDCPACGKHETRRMTIVSWYAATSLRRARGLPAA